MFLPGLEPMTYTRRLLLLLLLHVSPYRIVLLSAASMTL